MTRAGLTILLAAAVAVVPAAAGAAPAPLNRADAPAAQLERVDVARLAKGATVKRFEQEVAGIPVTGAGAVVVDTPESPPELLFDRSVEGLTDPGEPSVSSRDAIRSALAALGDPRGGGTDARLVISAAHENRLAWEVSHVDAYPAADWLVLVDARSGEVLKKRDLIRRSGQTGEAKLFVPNPVVTQGFKFGGPAEDAYFKLRDRKDRDTPRLTKLRTAVDLEVIKPGQSCLKGSMARVRLGREKKEVCKDSLRWNNITRAKNKFEALMSYHHVTETQRYIRSLDLGPINEDSQKVTANPISQDNSFYIPSLDEIQLGTGGVDDAEDSDVIVHEYGHAVQDDQSPSAFRGGFDSGAMGEGFGDYLAAAYSTERAGFHPEWTPCIMEWDATSYDDNFEPGICLRRADIEDTLPQRKILCGNSIHCVGQVWSSALLDLRGDIADDGQGRNIMDRVVLASHFLLPSSPSFGAAGKALLEADDALYFDGSNGSPSGDGLHCGQILAELTARQINPGVVCT